MPAGCSRPWIALAWIIAYWVRFKAVAGATYRIETSNLLGGSDTELELAEGCGPPVATDQDGGTGVASLLEYTPVADTQLDVRIRDEVGSGAGRGYDVEVVCRVGCPPCAHPGGDSFDLDAETIYSFRRIEACTRVTVRGPTRLRAGAEAQLFAGAIVDVRDGLVVDEGATLILGTDANLVAPP